jgi:hypothetical protein
MAKSHAQVNGHQVVNWKKELQLLIDGDESKVDLDLAQNWDTCYTGQQSELIERTDSTPDDGILEKLGNSFSEAVGNGEYVEALSITELIDIRCFYLLKKSADKLRAEIAEKEAELKELKLKLKKF